MEFEGEHIVRIIISKKDGSSTELVVSTGEIIEHPANVPVTIAPIKPVEKFCLKTHAELKHMSNTKTMIEHLNWNAYPGNIKQPEVPTTSGGSAFLIIAGAVAFVWMMAAFLSVNRSEVKGKNK